MTKALLLFHRFSQQAKELHTSVAQIIALWTGQYKKNLYESINFCFNQCATNQNVDEDSATAIWCNFSVCSAALNTSSASFKQIQRDDGQKFPAGVVCVVGRVTMATMEMSEKLAADGKRLPLNLFNVVTGCVLSQTVLSDTQQKRWSRKRKCNKKGRKLLLSGWRSVLCVHHVQFLCVLYINKSVINHQVTNDSELGRC